MPFDPAVLKAVIFDYGNTLIEFTRPHVDQINASLAAELHELFGEFDRPRFIRLRTEAYRACYFHPELRETTMQREIRKLVQALFDRDPTDGQVDALVDHHLEAFVALIEAPDYVAPLLERLRRRYRLALISNYPCGESIRRSLQRTGLDTLLEVVVVSGDVGHVKPHPILFETAVRQLGVAPGEAIYIGDNWLGDIQGAKRAGLHAAHITQFDTLEVFDREDGHHDADLVIGHLTELEAHLAAGAEAAR